MDKDDHFANANKMVSKDDSELDKQRCEHNHTTYRSDGYWDCYDCGAHLYPWSLVQSEKIDKLVEAEKLKARTGGYGKGYEWGYENGAADTRRMVATGELVVELANQKEKNGPQ